MPTSKLDKKPGRAPLLIELDAFPFEFLSAVARRESWRKEIHRPVYHIHKWWANRLGSIFRGIILGCHLPQDSDLEEAFYSSHEFAGDTVFDPFMGSGTTIGEAHKLGCTAIGRDINPVACESVRVAQGPLDRRKLLSAFERLSGSVGERIRELYRSTDKHGHACDVLYYFWVKNVPCPECGVAVDLFSSRVIARNANPDRRPEVQVCCPHCGDVFRALNGDPNKRCPACGKEFDADSGPASGAKATCCSCSSRFMIIDAVRASGRPPSHRLYAKLVLTQSGRKVYLPTTDEDQRKYAECGEVLRRELAAGAIRLPQAKLAHGYNTRQAIGYNYLAWRDFFNDRQLLALGWLQQAIAGLPDDSTRDAFLTLFSGLLEFNNMFASYKGEGTGAVRHMFSHHILKPEKMPIEANVWGTPKSSGSFSTLFQTRILRALDYRESPFEVGLGPSGKRHGCSPPFAGNLETSWPPSGNLDPGGVYLSCGSSDKTGMPAGCIDFVVTDPPFFDNVHYSELADFFYAWQSLYPHGFCDGAATTRHPREVQDTEAERFSDKLRSVLRECHRVLKDQGLLVFTYHHSRAEGWRALASALVGAGFSVINAHPVKAEMSVATPKSQAKEPIQLDVILVCSKTDQDSRVCSSPTHALGRAVARAKAKLDRLTSTGLKLSRSDRRVVVISQFLCELGPTESAETIVRALLEHQDTLEHAADEADRHRGALASPDASAQLAHPRQKNLPF